MTSSFAISGKELCFRLANHSLNEFAYKKMNIECNNFKEGFFEKPSTLCLLRSTNANTNFAGQLIYKNCVKNENRCTDLGEIMTDYIAKKSYNACKNNYSKPNEAYCIALSSDIKNENAAIKNFQQCMKSK